MNLLILLISFLLGAFIKVYDEILDEPSLQPYSTPPILNGLIGCIVVAGIAMMLHDPTILPFIGVSLLAMYLGDTVFYNTYVPYEHKSLDDGIWIKGAGVTVGLLLLMYLKDPAALTILVESTPKNAVWFSALIGGFIAIPVESWLFPEESSPLKTAVRIFVAVACGLALPITLFFNNLFYDSISLCLAASLGMIAVSIISKLLIVKNRDLSDPRNQSFIINALFKSYSTQAMLETYPAPRPPASPSTIPEEPHSSHTSEETMSPSPASPVHSSLPS